MDKLKSLWAKFKVQISFVAGCLVVATSMGTCSFDPSETSTEAVETTGTTEVVETIEVVETAGTSTEAVETTDNNSSAGSVETDAVVD